MYTDFAAVYDLLMRDVPYEKWAAHYAALLQKYGVERKKCVECACGTGALTVPLSKLGYKMTGVDLSGEMLEQAMKRAREAGQTIPFIKQDMCKLTLPSRTDAVLCTCDGVNYLAAKPRVSAFLKAAYAALKPGGVLIFDVSTPYKLKHTLGSGTRTFAGGDYAYIWNTAFSERTQICRMALTIFTKTDEGLYKRTEEEQVQRAHSREELTKALTDVGFERIRFFGGYSMRSAREKDARWHIAAVRPKERKYNG